RRAYALGEITLRNELELDFAGAIKAVEHVGIDLARERADDLAHAALGKQRRDTRVGVAGIVVDDGQIARALRDERVDELGGHAGSAESADHHGRTVVDAGDRLLERTYDL